MSAFPINDGFTVEDTIPRMGKWCPAVTIKYRPSLPEAYFEWQAASRAAANGKEKLRAYVALLTKQLVGWDYTQDGEPMAITKETLAQVPPPTLEAMLNVVTGFTTYEDADAKNA